MRPRTQVLLVAGGLLWLMGFVVSGFRPLWPLDFVWLAQQIIAGNVPLR